MARESISRRFLIVGVAGSLETGRATTQVNGGSIAARGTFGDASDPSYQIRLDLRLTATV